MIRKRKGGELGVVGPDDIMDEILAAIINLQPGPISEVVRNQAATDSTSSKSSSTPSFPAVKPLPVVKEDIRNHLRRSAKRAGGWNNWVETELVKQHDVWRRSIKSAADLSPQISIFP